MTDLHIILSWLVLMLWLSLVYALVESRRQCAHMRAMMHDQVQALHTTYHRAALRLIERRAGDVPPTLRDPQCFPAAGALDGRRSCGVYRVNKLVFEVTQLLRLKYGQPDQREATLICARLAEALAGQYVLAGWRADLVVSVPSAPAKLKARGFNQADLLARAFARRIGAPYQDVLRRARDDTAAQATIKRAAARRENLRGAFTCAQRIAGVVLIIDDVSTSGATMEECAAALKAAGAECVYGLTLVSGRV